MPPKFLALRLPRLAVRRGLRGGQFLEFRRLDMPSGDPRQVLEFGAFGRVVAMTPGILCNEDHFWDCRLSQSSRVSPSDSSVLQQRCTPAATRMDDLTRDALDSGTVTAVQVIYSHTRWRGQLWKSSRYATPDGRAEFSGECGPRQS